MSTEKIRNLIIAILFGGGFSFFTCTQYLGVWSTTLEKGILLLSGVFVLISALFFLSLEFILKKRRNDVTSRTFSYVLLLAVLLTGNFLLIFPYPERMTPDAMQIIVIKPENDKSASPDANKILVEEIKINGNPVILNDIKPSSGWVVSPHGLESESGTTIPLVFKNKGELLSDISVLFGKGPTYGSAQVRFAWQIQKIDLHQSEGESQVFISIPRSSSGFWWIGLYLSLWLILSGFFVLCALILLSSQILVLIPEKMTQSARSIFFWIVISMLFWYGFSFVRMVFFNPSHVMINENFLPAIRPIGNDLDLILDASKHVAAGGSPYASANKYPPLATILFLPLTKLHFLKAFQVITGITYFCFCFITLGLPFFLSKSKSLPTFAWLLFAFGLFSYGLFFEIERGQFNLIAIGMTFLAIVLFHKTPHLRWLAYFLFCMSIQLKIYPAIFVFFFTDDWRVWRKTLARWFSLGLANITLLFILGPKIFINYFYKMTQLASGTGRSNEPLNHSINGFLSFANYYQDFSDSTFTTIQLILTILVVSLVGLCFLISYRRNLTLDPYLFLTCTIAALLLPTLSNDYTLAYLIGPAIFLFIHLDKISNEQIMRERGDDIATVMLFGISAFAFTSSYFSYLQKPIPLQSHFPALLILLICTTILSLNEYRAIQRYQKSNRDD